MHPLHVQQERSHQTPKGNDFKQKHIYRLSAVQNTSQERWDFGWHYLASCPTPPGRGTLPGAAVRVQRPPRCPEALRPGRGGLAPRSSPSVSEKRFSASPSLPQPGRRGSFRVPPQRLQPSPHPRPVPMAQATGQPLPLHLSRRRRHFAGPACPRAVSGTAQAQASRAGAVPRWPRQTAWRTR